MSFYKANYQAFLTHFSYHNLLRPVERDIYSIKTFYLALWNLKYKIDRR